ncbi:uncharacterized protein FOMMEDRAFT_79224 [Fomitiporia mediterranea MF3/22]|uniref:uncharacterized protein n=1 Tax=Fomitiporia mediterranea (strain MF3/22) TaxID=694068 RepID=UPI0004409611|nr:uncharacterized protein FOMMEDRAFT_79224 [Fomitiporia mediterranea MF3/22]EJD05845.1 hypothetical protein FOMMEDRAFT_79224 [Fomitiporia mediterranea MF3/22]
MQAQRVKVTLSGPPQLTSTDLWAQVWSALALQFPLRNLHWKPATRTSIRTIQSLDVSLLALESLREEGTSQIPVSILDKLLLNIYVVACDDNDSYRSSVKKQIKEWHTQITQRKCQEWMILNISKTDPRQTQTGLLKMRGTVIDRIRADFNLDKKDRCAQLTWTTDIENPAIWAEIVSKVKDGVIAAFDQAVSQREEEVKRSELQKTMPGWNFCTFFILKESLASSFEGANLPEDALLQYEELEASFFQVLKDRTLWFGNFVEPSSKDDSLPLLSTTKKPYRDLIIANTITVFDIRVYLLARQSIVLGQMGRLTDVTRKVSMFLAAFGGRLRDYKEVLPNFFIESWVYSSALSVVETCDDWARRNLDSSSSNGYNAGKAELLASARNQLDKLGIQLGFLPNGPPFSDCVVDPESLKPVDLGTVSAKRSSRQISNPDILGFLSDKSSFYDLYIKLTNRAIDLFVKSGRRKFALKLHGSLAALDLFRERLTAALQTFTSLPAHYAPNRWSSLEAYMLFQSVETHVRLRSDHDRQWIHIVAAFLKAYLEDNSMNLLDGMTDKCAYIRRLIENVAEAAPQVDGELVFHDHPMMSVTPLIESARCAGDKDGYLFDVTIHNKLPCDVPFDNVTLYLSGRGRETMEFRSGSIVAEPGLQTVSLSCPVPKSGTYAMDKIDLNLGRLSFQWAFAGKQKRRQSSAPAEAANLPKLVKLPKDPRAVQIDIQQSLKVEIAGPSWLSVAISRGRNNLTKADLKLSSPDITINTKEGTLRSKCAEVKFLEGQISIANANSDQTIRFEMPHSKADNRDIVNVRAVLEYETSDEPGIVRKLSVEREVPLALDLAVNVQDFFRGEKLLTKFTISTTTHQHVRISSVDLISSDNDAKKIRISKHNKRPAVLTVKPAQPANFVFQLEKLGEVDDPLRLCMVYRLLREEVEALVTRHVEKAMPESDHWEHRIAVQDAIVRNLERSSSWVEMYEMAGEIHLPGGQLNVDGVPEELLAKVKQDLQKRDDLIADKSKWREFTIPLDLPRLDILVSTRIELVANPFNKEPLKRQQAPPIYAGQPITAIVSINTSFYWAGPDKKDIKEYTMRFQLEENMKDWLISGQKRGDFKAKDGDTYTVTITLMALRHGELSLPNVRVVAYPSDNNQSATPVSLEAYQVQGAERLLVLPRGGRTTFFLNVGREQ